MEISQIIPHIEALIFATDKPLPLLELFDHLNNALGFLEDRATLEQVEAAIEAIKEKYSSEFYAFEVRESGGGYQFLTKKDYYQTVAQLNGDKFLKRLSTAALETLAIVAYKQPISKGEIEHIRGVSTDYSIQKLLEKELIVISGRSEQLPGKPLLYATSKAFMDYFGLNSPKDLPKLKEVFEDEGVQPTFIGIDNTGEQEDDALNMVVSESGELIETELPLNEDPEAKLNGHGIQQDGDIPVTDTDEVLPLTDDAPASEDDDTAADISLQDADVNEDEDSDPEDGPQSKVTIPDTDPDTADTDDELAITGEAESAEAGLTDDFVANKPAATTENEAEADTEEDMKPATDEELAAFLAQASDFGPRDDDEDEDDEDDEDDDEEDGDDWRDDEDEDDEDNDEDDDMNDEDGDDEDEEDEEDEDEDGDTDFEDDDEAYGDDEDFEDDDEEDDEDGDNKK